jgi:hypothetical protein
MSKSGGGITRSLGLTRRSEQRVWVRHATDLPLRGGPIGKEPDLIDHAATIHDISAGGVGLRLQQSIPLGTLLTVRLQTRTRGWRTFLVQVKHVKTLTPDLYHFGCVFARPLEADELESLLG